ncbi:MAG: helix-turn-helix domain-containing protein [Gammaproteobacteria bacterium]|jgi:HTH-type transcriptional regulator/antitoxin HigA|nr:helix-turn-helix domain-containing protein [Gammaproteobacteria bacterium]
MDNATKNEYLPDHAVAPGELLDYELELRGMTRAELAKRTGLSEKHVIAIVKGKGTTIITPETAIKLERTLGMPVDYWLNLEANYQETRARLAEQVRLEKDLGWLDQIPIREMAKLGWIEKRKDKRFQLDELLRFFGIANVAQWKEVWPRLAVAYRQHNKHEIFPEAVSAWLRQGEIEAGRIDCRKYDKKNFRSALDQIRSITTVPEPEAFIPELQEQCAGAGVAVVFVPGLPKTGLSGATRWLKPGKALIQLSLRDKTNDHLWFTFFHEAAHILLHGKKELFLEGTSGMDEDREAEANAFAADLLIPSRAWRRFIERADFSLQSIQNFAEHVEIAPGIVIGRLQHEGQLPHTHGNKLKIRYEWA